MAKQKKPPLLQKQNETSVVEVLYRRILYIIERKTVAEINNQLSLLKKLIGEY